MKLVNVGNYGNLGARDNIQVLAELCPLSGGEQARVVRGDDRAIGLRDGAQSTTSTYGGYAAEQNISIALKVLLEL
jgi:hypothetical protein